MNYLKLPHNLNQQTYFEKCIFKTNLFINLFDWNRKLFEKIIKLKISILIFFLNLDNVPFLLVFFHKLLDWKIQ